MSVPTTEPHGSGAQPLVAVDLGRLPGIRRFAVDYAERFGTVGSFFAGDPTSPDGWRDAIARAGSRPRSRESLTRILAAQQAARNAPAEARQRAARLGNPGSVAIVTGQQAGLFGGPLYTLLKAITALQLAARVFQEYGVPAVAVFWVDSEDHDWEEVRSCTAFDESLSPCEISLLRDRGSDAQPVAKIALDDSIRRTLDDLGQTLPATEFREGLLADLRATYTAGSGMATAFASWMERVLGPHGLVVFDASDPAAKPLVAPLFCHELETAGTSARLAAAAGVELETRGYHAQVRPSEDSVALFHVNNGRQPVRRQGDRLLVGDQLHDRGSLTAEASSHPEGFSPNVLLRPIVQDALFPTIAYVAGPNELAYLGQLKGVYEHFDVPMPLMYPRATATILDRGAARFLDRYDVAVESLRAQDDSVLNALLARTMPAEVDQAFSDAVGSTETSLARLIKALPLVDPTLEGAGQTTLKRMQQDLETLRSKTIQAAKRRDETLRRQFTRTRAMVFPNGQLQERTIGFVSFLNQYGPALTEHLIRTLPLQPGKHWLLTV